MEERPGSKGVYILTPARRERRPHTAVDTRCRFHFLGFTHYWGRSRTGKVRMKRQASKKRLRRALGVIKQ